MVKKMENKMENKMKPQIDIDSMYLCAEVVQLGEESPDEIFCFATEQGAEAFMNGKPTYGFCFTVCFKNSSEEKLKQCYRGGVTLNVASVDGKTARNFVTKFKPSKVWPCSRYEDLAGAGTYFFTEEAGDEAEEFYDYAVKGGKCRITIEGLTVLNADFGVSFDISADFCLSDYSAKIGKEHIEVKETEVLPTESLVETRKRTGNRCSQ